MRVSCYEKIVSKTKLKIFFHDILRLKWKTILILQWKYQWSQKNWFSIHDNVKLNVLSWTSLKLWLLQTKKIIYVVKTLKFQNFRGLLWVYLIVKKYPINFQSLIFTVKVIRKCLIFPVFFNPSQKKTFFY